MKERIDIKEGEVFINQSENGIPLERLRELAGKVNENGTSMEDMYQLRIGKNPKLQKKLGVEDDERILLGDYCRVRLGQVFGADRDEEVIAAIRAIEGEPKGRS